ncbi:BnaAnng25270D [Brassica napus]|uniref:BnaA09g29850D protein n=1 Tax=Brassica napus TaxID=3708 RepID=A0A078FT29_BRANA|nr:BnaA09g29850D [Brassica napus]CDY67822.1 BnaAnng25270D [Brassica napus]
MLTLESMPEDIRLLIVYITST